MPSTRCGSSWDSKPLEPEDQRVVAAPLDRGLVAAGVELGQRGVSAARRAVPSASAVSGSSPSSTRGSRAKSSARRRSSPETGEAQPQSFFQPRLGVSLQGNGRPALSPRRNRSRAGQQGPPFVFAALSSPRAGSAPSPSRTVGVLLLWHTHGRLPPLGRMRRLAPDTGLAAAFAARPAAPASPSKSASTADFKKLDGAPAALAGLYREPSELLGRRPGRLQEAHRRAARPARGGERLGVLVRALPLRVPVLPEAGDQARQAVAFLGVNSKDNDGDARELPRQVPAAATRATRTPTAT